MPTGELWPFLKLIHPLSFDLATSTGQTEAQYKNLLAYTANATDSIAAANATWNELLREAGEGMANGKSYCRDDLSQLLRDRHSPVVNSSRDALRNLAEHSTLILNAIRTTIGPEIHLRRDDIVQRLLETMELNRVVIVTGPSGSGKSGIAKNAIQHLSETFAFSFRAEEFAVPHLDEVLVRAQIPLNATTLGAVLAGQERKLLLVESVERLLEASTREAFTDLLTLVKDDQSWQLILTCRDYSTDVVRSSMLQFMGVAHSVLIVPPLGDDELAEVGVAIPKLSRPLADSRLRNLLRNPYLFDKTSQMEWPDDRPLPESERAFRGKVLDRNRARRRSPREQYATPQAGCTGGGFSSPCAGFISICVLR